ncbi:IPT/TIG domain-containing protein [Geodermatophilus sp. SYSU D00804]
MEQTALDTAFLTRGIAHVAFWNGRVLTAEDLRAEQLANHLGLGRLGRAGGQGITSGLAVRPGSRPASVHVSAGLAVDRLGQVLELPVDVSVSLVVPPETASGDGVFTVCDPVSSSAAATGTGLYLLVLRPASAARSSAAGVPALGTGAATECGPRYTVDGVSFRLVTLDVAGLAAEAGHDDADDAVLGSLGTVVESPLARNVVAHLFLGTRAWADLLADPFGAVPDRVDRGALAILYRDTLLDCEVPLAVVSWSFDGVGFVDSWAVRRPRASWPAYTAVQSLAGPAREVLGRAGFSQFQEHLSTVRDGLTAAQRATFALTNRFRYLPAAGLVPVARPGRPGFEPGAVFGDLVVRGPVGIAAARVGAILDESFRHPAIDVTSGEVLFVYAVDDPGAGSPAYLLFCTSRMPFLGEELVIDAVFPGGALSLGQRIEIRGRGFGFSTGEARVRFDATATAALPGSTDTRLLVDVPTSLAVDPDGSEVTLEVSNGVDSDAVPVIVGHRVQPVLGDLHVTWESVEPAELEGGAPATIRYTLRSALNQAADVQVRLGGSPDEFLAAAELRDASGLPISDPVAMEPDEVAPLVVAVDPVPDVAEFTVSLGATVADVTAADTRVFRTGTPTIPADPAITILVVDTDVHTGTVERVGDAFRMSPGATADIELLVEVTEPGSYHVRVEPRDLTGPWRSVLSEPEDGVFEDIPPSELEDGVARRTARVTVQRATAPPPPSAVVAFAVQRPGRPSQTQVTFLLEVL